MSEQLPMMPAGDGLSGHGFAPVGGAYGILAVTGVVATQTWSWQDVIAIGLTLLALAHVAWRGWLAVFPRSTSVAGGCGTGCGTSCGGGGCGSASGASDRGAKSVSLVQLTASPSQASDLTGAVGFVPIERLTTTVAEPTASGGDFISP